MSQLSDELNFQRLLHRCKKLSRDALADNKYKLDAFIRILEDLYMKLQDEKSIVNDVLMQYGREFHNLKTLIEVEKKKTAEEKLEAMQALPKIFPGEGQEIRHRPAAVGSSISGDADLEDKVSNAVIKAANEAVYRADIRRQLMAGSKPDFDFKTATNEVDFLNNQETTQAELSEDLLKLTLALKENVQVAGSVIKDDNATLTQMQQLAIQNRQDLGREQERLEQHVKRSCVDCMMLMMIVLVIWVFLACVLVMKFFRKKI